jgi:hypothetical protein
LKEPITWKEATQKIIGASSSSEKDLLSTISAKTTFKDEEEKNRLIAGLKWGEQFRVPLDFILLSPRWFHGLSKV